MPGDKEERGKLEALGRFFSKIGKAVTRTGKVTSETPARVKKAVKGEVISKEGGVSLSERLRELKRLGERGPEEEEALWEEEEEWEEIREELRRPVSDRLADVFSGPFKSPANYLTGFFSGLEEDLSKAHMRVSAERYVRFLLGVGFIVGVFAFFFFWLMVWPPFPSLLAADGLFLLTVFVGRVHLKARIRGRVKEVNQEIPYALRHMATQLSSGIGLPETMTSVSRADYGALTEEFRRALRDMRAGVSMSNALASIRDRVDSDPLKRAIRQMRRTLRTGGNLARTLNIMAEEAAFDLRMKLRDYTESLNMLTMIYMFASAVIPSLLIVVIVVMRFMGGGLIPLELVVVLYLFLFPFILIYLVIFFKRMEPEV